MDITALLFIWLATAIGLGIATLIIPGIRIDNVTAFLLAAIVLGLINAFIRPVLWFLTIPLTVVTFGLFTLVINALMIMLTAAIVPGFEVKGFGSAFLCALLMVVLGIIGFIAMPLLSGADINWYYYEHHSRMFP